MRKEAARCGQPPFVRVYVRIVPSPGPAGLSAEMEHSLGAPSKLSAEMELSLAPPSKLSAIVEHSVTGPAGVSAKVELNLTGPAAPQDRMASQHNIGASRVDVVSPYPDRSARRLQPTCFYQTFEVPCGCRTPQLTPGGDIPYG